MLALTPAERSDEGIEDHQGGINPLHESIQDGEVAREGEGAAGVGAIGDGDEDDDALQVATGGINAGTDGVVDVVLSREEEDSARSSPVLSCHRGGDRRGRCERRTRRGGCSCRDRDRHRER